MLLLSMLTMLLLTKAKSIRNSRHAPLVAVGAVVFFITLFYLRPSIFMIPTFHPWSPVAELSQNQLVETTDLFDEPLLNSPAIKNLCANTEWNSKLLFTCNRSGGGVGNLRNSILNCVRYAISAGASLTLPRVILRDPNDIAHIWERETTSFDYLFDEAHFVESLRLSCPQLQFYNDTKDFAKESEVTLMLQPESLMEDTPTGIAHPEGWRGKFYGWLSKERDANSPVVVNLERSYLKYPIYSDLEGFVLDFGKVLKFRKEAREVATTVLKNLVSTYDLNANFGDKIWKGTFFGAHLRTESDSQKGFPTWEYEYSRYEVQSHYYLEQAAASGLPVIYLASGEVRELAKFTADAQKYNLTVSTKHDLVNGEDMKLLETFTFDQQALVDFLVLEKSSQFAGVGHSSFAWNIALWRHQFAKQRDHLNGPQLMSDELSQIYGTVGQYLEYAACLWP